MAQRSDPEYINHLRHSAAHLLAAAVVKLWPGAKPTIGPAIEDGFYYDFDFGQAASPNSKSDLEKLEKKMHELVSQWETFERIEVTPQQAQEIYKLNQYKLELISDLADKGEPITLYYSGPKSNVPDPRKLPPTPYSLHPGFIDLCRGGHVDNPSKELKHFKLLSVAGAYWRGDEKNPMLTRIYGTAFGTKKELDEHLKNLEEASRRDHRKLGKQLDLFTSSPLVGSGLPLFTPRGTIIRHELECFVRSLQEARGYQQVTIPHLAKAQLYEVSGHLEKFGENLFRVKGREEEFVVKPMNCPHHTQIYAARARSYKDLPLRLAETTTIYRDEKAGELLGLARVRSITQDDAHVFCTPEQLPEEIATVIDLVREFYAAFDFELELHLSLRDRQTPEKYLGDDSVWDKAEAQLAASLDAAKMPYVRDEGEAAFYGPKIDFMARDSLKRTWQLATIQLDFTMPVRFGLTYTDDNGTERTPVMIHRAITGSLERFMAILLEHYAGALPLWLSPTQVAVLPISDDQLEYARTIADQLRSAGIRVEVDERSESIGKKIREAELMKVPVMLIAGKKEVRSGTVAVRTRAKGDEGASKLEEVQTKLLKQYTERMM